MDSEITAAIIALGGVVLSAAVSLLIARGSTKYNYRELFAKTISKDRMDWVNIWRKNLSTFTADIQLLSQLHRRDPNNDLSAKKDELWKEALKAKGMITMRLNLTERKHQYMFAALNGIRPEEENYSQIIAKCEYIEQLGRMILKEEWERIKKEAKKK